MNPQPPFDPAAEAEIALREALGRLWCKAEGLDPDDVISDAGHTVLCATLGGLDPIATAAFNKAAAPLLADIAALRTRAQEARFQGKQASSAAFAAEAAYDTLAANLAEFRAEVAATSAEAKFLLARLAEFENDGGVTDDNASDWYGHVRPSVARLTALIAAEDRHG